MITYRCDRCGSETTPDRLFEFERVFTPHTLDGGENPDEEDRVTLGQVCADCTDRLDELVGALVNPPAVQGKPS